MTTCPIDLPAFFHNAVWEKNYQVLFQPSVEWLTKAQ